MGTGAEGWGAAGRAGADTAGVRQRLRAVHREQAAAHLLSRRSDRRRQLDHFTVVARRLPAFRASLDQPARSTAFHAGVELEHFTRGEECRELDWRTEDRIVGTHALALPDVQKCRVAYRDRPRAGESKKLCSQRIV